MSKKEFTATEVMSLVEDVQSQFRVVAESVSSLHGKVDHLGDRVGHLEGKVDHLSLGVDHLSVRVDHLSVKVDHLAEMTELNSEDISEIKIIVRAIKDQKADKEEVDTLRKAITSRS